MAGVAAFMARLYRTWPTHVRLLDAGAGVGSLTAAFVEHAVSRKARPEAIDVTLYEVDPTLLKHLNSTVRLLAARCRERDVDLKALVSDDDFIDAGTDLLQHDLLGVRQEPEFNRVIMNPPYRKIRSDSATRRKLRSVGIESTNLYTAFLAVAVGLLEPGGELVAITPRSFCNGPYFRPFREMFFGSMTLKRVHVFESRAKAFSDDDVLQENVIFHAVKTRKRGNVLLSTSEAPGSSESSRSVHHDDVVWPSDPQQFVHLVLTDDDAEVTAKMRGLPCTLGDLRLSVSTGRVVDFRAKEHLRKEPTNDSVPLIYPCHLTNGFVEWPTDQTRKPNALADNDATRFLMVPEGTYTLTKRFTSKEERRRVVAAIFDPRRVRTDAVGFENHLNYFHQDGRGLAPEVARGLACFLNSTLVDRFFRLFSGHTQVNATDLRLLRYPSREQLERLADLVGDEIAEQEAVDHAVDAVLSHGDQGNDSAKKCLAASS